jgi:hypothetical protein
LYEELRETPIQAVFAIDQYAARIECGIPICTMDSEEFYSLAEQVDAIVVTALSVYEEICQELKKKYGGAIMSLGEILVEMINEW